MIRLGMPFFIGRCSGGDMSRVGTGSVGTEGTARSEDGGVRTADMDPSEEIESEAGRTPLCR